MNKIAFIGTSFTYCYCENESFDKLKEENTWPYLLAQKLNKNYLNFGLNGASNQDLLEIFIKLNESGYLDEIDQLIIEPRTTSTPVRVDGEDFLKLEESFGSDKFDDNLTILHTTRNNKDYDFTNPDNVWPSKTKFYRNVAPGWPTEFFYKKLQNSKLKKQYIEKYLQYHAYVKGDYVTAFEICDMLSIIKIVCDLKGIKFNWVYWSFFENWNNICNKKVFGNTYDCLINKKESIEYYIENNNNHEIYCSCRHFNDSVQSQIADYIYQGLKNE